MDIFKLFFNHDQRLDKLAKRNANKTKEEIEATLDDFINPDPTYSKFYITGTQLENEKFGLNQLAKSKQILTQLDNIFNDRLILGASGEFSSLAEAVNTLTIGETLVIAESKKDFPFSTLRIDEESNVGHKKDALRTILQDGNFVFYKEPAHHGFDLHLFSMENIYPALFRILQPLVDENFRFFSINSKRMGSERHFYFETWTLDNPPHGAEEVFTETEL